MTAPFPYFTIGRERDFKKSRVRSMRILKEDELRAHVSDGKLRNFCSEYNDSQLKQCMAHYLFLRDHAADLPLDKPSIYYSMYYWFVRFKRRYYDVCGHDEGIEQEGFKLLEKIDRQLEEGVDWRFIEQIEKKEV